MAIKDIKKLARNDAGIATAMGILKQRFGEKFKDSDSLREQHAHNVTYLPAQLPDCVIWPQTTEDTAEIVRICSEHKVPVIPYGTGTSLEGGVNAPAGGVCIDLQEMDAIISVNAEDLDVCAQPGVTRETLNEYLRDQGLFFPIDPGANASLGGMAATRASGTNAVRYGTMRENVVNITAVMADGSIVKTAKRSRKSAAGYDLTKLLVGSEGTLGIITELTLRLYGIPEAISAAICSFPTLEDACNTTIAAMQIGIPMARIELMDAQAVEAVNNYSKVDNPVSPLLLLEFHGTENSVKEQSDDFGELARENGGTGFQWVTKTEDRNRLWSARHNAYWAMKDAVKPKDMVTSDVCVPISKLAQCVIETQKDIEDAGLFGPILGHVGDGNFHASVAVNLNDPEELGRVEKVMDRIVERALAMDGTCTGEHGIGQGKMQFLEREHGKGTQYMSAIKKAFDPDNILNPGKVVSV